MEVQKSINMSNSTMSTAFIQILPTSPTTQHRATIKINATTEDIVMNCNSAN